MLGMETVSDYTVDRSLQPIGNFASGKLHNSLQLNYTDSTWSAHVIVLAYPLLIFETFQEIENHLNDENYNVKDGFLLWNCRCKEKVVRIQKVDVLVGIFICGVPGCLRSFLVQPDFELHVANDHSQHQSESTKGASLGKPNPSQVLVAHIIKFYKVIVLITFNSRMSAMTVELLSKMVLELAFQIFIQHWHKSSSK